MLAQLMTPGEGVTVPRADADPRVGGNFNIIMLVGENELPHGSEYLSINPHSQLIFIWQSGRSVDGLTVSLNFTETNGGTNVELTQVKFLDEAARNDHQGGWTAILSCLDSALG